MRITAKRRGKESGLVNVYRVYREYDYYEGESHVAIFRDKKAAIQYAEDDTLRTSAMVCVAEESFPAGKPKEQSNMSVIWAKRGTL